MGLPYFNTQDPKLIQRNVEWLEQRVSEKYNKPIPASANWTSTATYSKIGRLVVLAGFFSKTGGTGTPVANDVMGVLPADARPLTQMNVGVATQNSDVNGTILIQPTGNIVWRTGSTAEADETCLDGIAYVASK